MSAEAATAPIAPRVNALPRWTLPVVWALCTLALLPLFFAARWAGNEVASFQMTTYESAARKALANKDYAGALKYCNGAIKAAHNHSEHWGRVYTLRALAYVGQGNMEQAADEIVRAGDFFARRYYYAEDQDRREVPELANAVGLRLLQANDKARALAVYSAGAMASGKPVDALYDLFSALTPAQRFQLWVGTPPYIYVTACIDPKENVPKAYVNDQGRPVIASHVNVGEGADKFARVELGASQKDATCWLGVPADIAISQRPFGIRVRAKEDKVAPLKLLLSYWFESPQKSAMTEYPSNYDDPKGWTTFEIARPFFAERVAEAQKNGYSPEGGIINQISISVPPGDANAIALAPVELYIPQS